MNTMKNNSKKKNKLNNKKRLTLSPLPHLVSNIFFYKLAPKK